MKKILFTITILASVFYGCKKEIVGPKGDTGATGATGQQGTTGLSNQMVFFGQAVPAMWQSYTNPPFGNHLTTINYVVFQSYTNNQPPFNLDSSTVTMYV